MDNEIFCIPVGMGLVWFPVQEFRVRACLNSIHQKRWDNVTHAPGVSASIGVAHMNCHGGGQFSVVVHYSIISSGRSISCRRVPASRLSSGSGMVEAHGGRIRAESDGPGLGARFTFTIPTAEEGGVVSPLPQLSTRPSLRSQRARDQVRILAVDDDPQALRYIRDALAGSGYAVIATGDPGDVPLLMAAEKPHLVLLDLMLPGVDGMELMQDIMVAGDVPVIFVSAYGQDRLVARAFEMGADDYVVKPFAPIELVARIGAALRRRTTSEPPVPYVSGDLVVDYAERLVTLRGVPVSLTAIEYRLLFELSANAGRVVTYEQLLTRVWGSEAHGDVRPIRTAVSALRRKLQDDAEDPAYIFTELRVGYRLPRADMLGTQR